MADKKPTKAKAVIVAAAVVIIGGALISIAVASAGMASETPKSDVRTPQQTALWDAIQADNEKNLSALLVAGTPVDLIIPVPYQFRPGTTVVKRMTGLMLAAERGNEKLTRLFLEKGAAPNLNDGDRWMTPLLYAVRGGNPAVVRALLAKGANPNCAMNNATGRTDSSALHLAVNLDRFEIVKLLVEAGADLNARDYKHLTPLDRARAGLDKALAQYLESRGAKSALEL